MKIEQFSPKQAEILKFIADDNEILICDGAVRSGKTVVMTLSFVIWAMSNFNHTNFAICGKTVTNAERNIIKPFQELEQDIYYLEYKRSNRCLVIKCKGIVNYFYVFGGKDESSYSLIQGATLAGVLFDEVALMPKSFVDQAIARTLSFSNSKIWFNCNPESANHWFYKEWIEIEKPKTKHLHFLMYDNPILTDNEIKRAERLYKGVFYDRYIRGLWVVAEGIVYPMFSDNNLTDDIPTDCEYYISIDYGTVNPFSAGLWAVTANRAVRIDEIYYNSRENDRRVDDNEYYKMLEELIGSKQIQCIVIDPSAASFIETIRKHAKYTVKKANNNVLDGIRVVTKFLNSEKLQINHKCRATIDEFGKYVWDEKSIEDRPVKENDHAMDDIRYFCATILNRRFKWIE